jgi:hypothetical protein
VTSFGIQSLTNDVPEYDQISYDMIVIPLCNYYTTFSIPHSPVILAKHAFEAQMRPSKSLEGAIQQEA